MIKTESDIRSEKAFKITKKVITDSLQTLREVRAGISECPKCGHELFFEQPKG